MEIKKLICDCCKKEFTQEYYTGGYIDHTNFSNSFYSDACNGKDIDIDRLVKETCYYNYEFRNDDDRADRINCVCMALVKNRKYEKLMSEYLYKVNAELDKEDIVNKEVDALKEKYKDADKVILMNISKRLC